MAVPPPIFADRWQLRNVILNEKIIPAIRQVAKETGVTLIDFNTPMLGLRKDFPDGVHPNASAAAKLAEAAAKAIRESQAAKRKH